MKKKMAIISSYNESCGNASYTEVLREEFSKYCDVDILALPQGLLHGKYAIISKKADAFIDQMCEKIKEYDYVNIQFEAGLFGNTRKEILRRYSKIVKSCKNVIVTMHRVDLPRPVFNKGILKKIIKLKFWEAFQDAKFNKFMNLYVDVVEAVRQKGTAGSIMVHTQRERDNLVNIFDYPNVTAFPITFMNAEKRKRVRTEADRKAFLQAYGFNETDVVIGLFGFVSAYKSAETVIKALNFLPSNYKIAIFGKQHPMSILENVPVDEYLNSLMSLIESQSISAKDKLDIITDAQVQSGKVKEEEVKQFIQRYSNEKVALSFDQRVFFEGELDDDHFIDALYGCDFAVLPYLETNQSGSGIASLVVESKIKSIFSSSKAFAELQRYFPKCYESFDIGNYIELANKILNYKADYAPAIERQMEIYNIENNVKNHMKLFEQQAK